MEIHKQRGSLGVAGVQEESHHPRTGELRLQALVCRGVRHMERLEPSLVKMGQVGEGLVQVCVGTLAQTTVLAILISV